jgi:hypothetical protein
MEGNKRMGNRKVLCLVSVIVLAASSTAQLQLGSPPGAGGESTISQIRKSVTFVRLNCKDGAHNFDVRGTGFFVSYSDPRLAGDRVFLYLVTNRHVALCWNESGRAMEVKNISIRLNRRVAEAGNYSQEVFLNEHGNANWITPEDRSVDLAVLPYLPDQARFDYKVVSTNAFATKDILLHNGVAEGEPVLFAGFFQQFPGKKRMEPIVRQGIVAMIPDENIPFVDAPERLYLADVHVFGGNSGAPAFVNLGGLHGASLTIGEDYRLFGIVNGFVFEDENFNLRLATSFKGKVRGNSGVATMVPVDELKALLEDPRLRDQREIQIRNLTSK